MSGIIEVYVDNVNWLIASSEFWEACLRHEPELFDAATKTLRLSSDRICPFAKTAQHEQLAEGLISYLGAAETVDAGEALALLGDENLITLVRLTDYYCCDGLWKSLIDHVPMSVVFTTFCTRDKLTKSVFGMAEVEDAFVNLAFDRNREKLKERDERAEARRLFKEKERRRADNWGVGWKPRLPVDLRAEEEEY